MKSDYRAVVIGGGAGGGEPVARGYIPREPVSESNGFEIGILGQIYQAKPQAEPLYDADHSPMRT